MQTVYSNQKKTGKYVIKAFNEESFDHVLLLAQMQMGKSGTYWYVIFSMLFGNYGIDNVIVMSGNREIELFEQVQQDKVKYTEWFLNQKHVIERCTEKEINIIKRTIEKKIRILWGSDLGKDQGSVKANTLIVWDESHFAQSRENKPYGFLEKNDLTHLVDGSNTKNEKNIKILTVSATPFSELVLNVNKRVCKTIRLNPSENYYGVSYYKNTNAIKPSFQVSEENSHLMKELIDSYKDEKKYIIVRVTNTTGLSVMVRICNALNVDCKEYNAKRKDICIEQLKEAPDKLTVIVISGMLRMGKVIPKEHIAMVFESSTQGNNKKADTVLQGLLGRMCGYTTKEDGFDVKIYIEDRLIQELDEYIDRYDTEHGPIVLHAMNVRADAPVKWQPKLYHLIKVPMDNFENMSTKCGKIKTNEMRIHLQNKIDTINIDDEEKTTLSQLIECEKTQFVSKDVEKKSNNYFKKSIDKVTESKSIIITGYRDISNQHLYILSYPSKQECYLLFRSCTELPTVEQEMNRMDFLYVLDKCVFKNIN